MRKQILSSLKPEFVTITRIHMADSFFSPFKIRELRKLEKSIQITIQLLSSYLSEDNHDGNAIFLTLAAEGMGLKFKRDYIQAEIQSYEQILEQIQVALLAK